MDTQSHNDANRKGWNELRSGGNTKGTQSKVEMRNGANLNWTNEPNGEKINDRKGRAVWNTMETKKGTKTKSLMSQMTTAGVKKERNTQQGTRRKKNKQTQHEQVME